MRDCDFNLIIIIELVIPSQQLVSESQHRLPFLFAVAGQYMLPIALIQMLQANSRC